MPFLTRGRPGPQGTVTRMCGTPDPRAKHRAVREEGLRTGVPGPGAGQVTWKGRKGRTCTPSLLGPRRRDPERWGRPTRGCTFNTAVKASPG